MCALVQTYEEVKMTMVDTLLLTFELLKCNQKSLYS